MTKKFGAGDFILFLSAIALMVVPFLQFVALYDEPTDTRVLMESHKIGDLWHGYAYILLAIIVIVVTILKKDIFRYIMMALLLGLSGFWTYHGIYYSMLIHDGYFYIVGPGYYVMLIASLMIIICTLSAIMKEKNVKKD